MKAVSTSLIAVGMCTWVAADALRDVEPVEGDTPNVQPAKTIRFADAGDEPKKRDKDEAPLAGPRHQPRKDRWNRFGPGELRRPGGPPHPGPMGLPFEGELPPLSPKEVERLLEVARQHVPELHEKLRALRDKDPEAFRRMMQRARHPLMEMARKGRDGEQIRLHMQIRRLRRAYHDARSDARRDEFKEQIKERIRKLGDLDLDRLRHDIEAAEARLEKLKKELAEKEAHKEQFVEERLQHVLDESMHPPAAFPKHAPGRRKSGPRRPAKDRT